MFSAGGFNGRHMMMMMIGYIKIFQRAVKAESRSMPSPWLQNQAGGCQMPGDVMVVLLNS